MRKLGGVGIFLKQIFMLMKKESWKGEHAFITF